VLGLIGPGMLALIWFDVVGTGTPRRPRLALMGFMGVGLGALTCLMLIAEAAAAAKHP